MIFTQHYLDCLSQASYLIGDETTGRAVVVDPRRDIQEYLDDAAAAGLTIELVIETHYHADFVSGHLELAAATGAAIGYGEAADAEFPIRRLREGERISLGDVTLQVLATPGHTPESISVVVYEHPTDAVPYGVLTGDTLFIGDVGRPDLLASVGVSQETLARDLYGSLHDKLLRLDDATLVYPAHGAGSACGKNLSTATVSTIAEQRETNYALAIPTVEEFVTAVTEGQPEAPAYFAYNAQRNRQARDLLTGTEPPGPLGLDEVLRLQADGAVVVDTRGPASFATGHLHSSVNIGLEGRFAELAGSVVAQSAQIVLIAAPETRSEAKLRLARIGFDAVAGELTDPEAAFLERPELVERSSRLTASELDERLQETDVVVLDVRNPGEVALGALPGARLIALTHLRDAVADLDPDKPTVVYCAGGYRSSITASLLRAEGFSDVSDLIGGYGAWASRHTTDRSGKDA